MSTDNEFSDLTVKELKAVAEQFAVDLDDVTKKADIVSAIEADGVTFKMYRDLLAPDEEEPVELAFVDDAPLEDEEAPEEDLGESVVVKMVRKNWSYEARGHRFTQDHPYALVKEDDADYLIEEDGGFRMASPKELREYYGA